MVHERFMRAALELAAENARAGQGGPFGAVVVKDGTIIARGSNSVVPLRDPTAHAEVQAIRAACTALRTFQLTDCDIYTSCEPCPMCLGALYWARPRAVYYAATCTEAAAAGFDDTLIYDEVARSLETRRLPFIRLLANEAGAPFAAWRANPNRVEY